MYSSHRRKLENTWPNPPRRFAAKLGTITKSLSSKETNLGHTIGVVGKSLDDLHTQCLSAWSAMDKLEVNSTLALKASEEVQKICSLQQTDLTTMAATVNEAEAMAIEAQLKPQQR